MDQDELVERTLRQKKLDQGAERWGAAHSAHIVDRVRYGALGQNHTIVNGRLATVAWQDGWTLNHERVFDYLLDVVDKKFGDFQHSTEEERTTIGHFIRTVGMERSHFDYGSDAGGATVKKDWITNTRTNPTLAAHRDTVTALLSMQAPNVQSFAGAIEYVGELLNRVPKKEADRTSKWRKEKEAKQKKAIADAEAAQAEARKEADRASGRLDGLNDSYQNVRRQLDDSNSRIEQLLRDKITLEEKVKRITAELSHANTRIERFEAEAKRHRSESAPRGQIQVSPQVATKLNAIGTPARAPPSGANTPQTATKGAYMRPPTA